MIVLIPAYEPDERMRELVDALDTNGFQTVVVDDGSGAAYSPHFAEAARRGATVLRQPRNEGKARALRHGLAYIAERWPGEDVVTADSDGQHRPSDIAAVAAATVGSDALVLGGRSFTGEVPVRSRLGNAVSRWLFRLSGGAVHDTQTGLRGIPAALITDVVAVSGERFAWEMNVLLDFTRRGIPIREVPIETVYLDHNASSHFRPLRDSLDVLRPLLRYVLVSFGSFLLDVALLQLLYAVTGDLLLSAVGARVLSAAVNFTLNRSFVFRDGSSGGVRRQLGRYAALALALLAGGYASMALFVAWGVPVLWAKLLADAAVYTCGFLAQRGYVFRRGEGRRTLGSVEKRVDTAKRA
ncbi:GtrA family protein [Microbacterium sp. NPDC087591]|uniref:GtrA family protein n=1 Tax=Microbacterium sp. NPDC087591 TaxID=3364192 RepID=UPI00382D2C05